MSKRIYYPVEVVGSKRQRTLCGAQSEEKSYRNIAMSLGVDDPSQIMFATDIEAEAVAASAAGWGAVLVVRPGNKPLAKDGSAYKFRQLTSLEELLC